MSSDVEGFSQACNLAREVARRLGVELFRPEPERMLYLCPRPSYGPAHHGLRETFRTYTMIGAVILAALGVSWTVARYVYHVRLW